MSATELLEGGTSSFLLPLFPAVSLYAGHPTILTARIPATDKPQQLAARNRGWGVRSWDAIPCGAPVAVFYGAVFPAAAAGAPPFEDDTYHFDCAARPDVDDDERRRRPPPGGGEGGSGGGGGSGGEASAAAAAAPPPSRFAICAKRQGGVARFINHSCAPNLYVQPLCVGHADREMVGIGLFAGMPIPAWTELT